MVAIRQFKRLVLLFCVFVYCLDAEEIRVSADSFFADENKFYSILTGNVVVNKGDFDTLKAEQIEIFFNQDKQPIKYRATKNVTFKILLKDKHYDGSGNELIYEPLQDRYTIVGNAYLHEVEEDKKVYGDKIVADQKSGTYQVDAKKGAQTKMIFQIQGAKKEEVVATADKFYFNDGALKASLIGKAQVVKGKDDVLNANQIDILFDADKKPLKYVATGDAYFRIFMNLKHYNGKGGSLIYEPNKELYTLKDNAFLQEVEDNKQIFGDIITVDQNKGHYAVNSNKKAPVKLFFKVEGK